MVDDQAVEDAETELFNPAINAATDPVEADPSSVENSVNK